MWNETLSFWPIPADETAMKARLVLSVAAAITALGSGVAAVLLSAPLFGLIAGIIGLLVGIGAAAIAVHARETEDQLVRTIEELQQVQHDLDQLAGVIAKEDEERNAADSNELAYDDVSGLLEEQFFAVIVQQRVAAARRHLQPVSVVLFELDGYKSENVDPKERDDALALLGEVVRETLRESDAACRLGNHMAAAVLEDTTEAGAVWAAERVRAKLLSGSLRRTLTVSAGVACYPSHALTSHELFEAATAALERANEQGSDQVEIAPHEQIN